MFADADGQQVTTGTPISLLIRNVDQRSKDYGDINDKFRPGHADFTYWKKYGIRDYRGGGRSSARETAARVAAGAVARKVLAGRHHPRRARADRQYPGRPLAVGLGCGRRQPVLLSRRRDGRRTGPTTSTASASPAPRSAPSIEVVAEGVPAGWGAPIYAKLDQDLASAMMSINAVKGVEIGAGMGAAELTGEAERRRDPHRPPTASRASCRTTPAASSAASPPGSRSSAASP